MPIMVADFRRLFAEFVATMSIIVPEDVIFKLMTLPQPKTVNRGDCSGHFSSFHHRMPPIFAIIYVQIDFCA
jgi:hypothetical protein